MLKRSYTVGFWHHPAVTRPTVFVWARLTVSASYIKVLALKTANGLPSIGDFRMNDWSAIAVFGWRMWVGRGAWVLVWLLGLFSIYRFFNLKAPQILTIVQTAGSMLSIAIPREMVKDWSGSFAKSGRIWYARIMHVMFQVWLLCGVDCYAELRIWSTKTTQKFQWSKIVLRL